MSGLQGESTLSDDEKRSEAQRHVTYLRQLTGLMAEYERKFVERLANDFDTYGNRVNISNKQLFWLRDLVVKY